MSKLDPTIAPGVNAVLVRPGLWPDMIRAAFELGFARWQLGRRQIRELVSADVTRDMGSASSRQQQLVSRVAWVIPRVAGRVPWRADCLVQATAAQRWLARHDIKTEICIGTRKDHQEGFEAHAWLCHGEDVIIGGDVSGFVPLITVEPASRSPDRNKS